MQQINIIRNRRRIQIREQIIPPIGLDRSLHIAVLVAQLCMQELWHFITTYLFILL